MKRKENIFSFTPGISRKRGKENTWEADEKEFGKQRPYGLCFPIFVEGDDLFHNAVQDGFVHRERTVVQLFGA